MVRPKNSGVPLSSAVAGSSRPTTWSSIDSTSRARASRSVIVRCSEASIFCKAADVVLRRCSKPLASRDLLPKLPVQVRDHASERLDFAGGQVVLGLAIGRTPGLADKHLVEPANRLVARGKSVAQLLLLPVELLDQLTVLLLQLPQPANVGAIGGADEMRQHVHVAERLLHERIGRDRMAQHGPIGARDVAALDQLLPHPAQRLFVLGTRE